MKKQYQAVTAAEAVRVIKSGDHVHISSVSKDGNTNLRFESMVAPADMEADIQRMLEE